MKRETPNAKRRAVSISPSSKNHMTATIRRGFALLIENGLTQGAIGRISYKIEVEGGAYKGVTARRESNDYGVMETKIDKYELTASFAGEEAKGVEVATEEQRAEADTLTAKNVPDYRDKEIIITMHCPIKGHKVARLVSMGMFSIPDYNAEEGWECNMITEDEGKRMELIKQWIDERANEQHESNLEFVKYEIVKEGVFAERGLNWQFRLEAEKQGCEPAAEVATEAMLDIQEMEKVEANPIGSNEAENQEETVMSLNEFKPFFPCRKEYMEGYEHGSLGMYCKMKELFMIDGTGSALRQFIAKIESEYQRRYHEKSA